LAEQGHESIVSIHLTSALSGPFESATMAAADSPVPVAVVDTKRVSQAVALVVREACAARDAGAGHDEIERIARHVSTEMRLFFVLDTLEYLVKGGRAGKAQGLAASLLSIKPVLAFNSEGIIEPFKKVKGRKKALAELAAHVAEDARTAGHLRGSLLHACAEDVAADLESEIRATIADIELISRGLVGSVIGTYAGPDAVGIAYYPAM
jgi:DegV family protein with EDD domain